MGGTEMHTWIWKENLTVGDHVKGLGLVGKIILQQIVKK
jgi:hypothetical protein